jgi:L-asparaginase
MQERKNMNRLLIMAAGGTIDAAEYNFETGSVISFARPAARHICERTMPDAVSRNIELICPFQKDSDVMTEQDRQEILAICSRSPCTQIIITHGTGTMIDTGRLLAENLKQKTVVLTGSLPYAHDPVYAAFNMGNAVTACQLLQPGVYIATSGEIVSLDKEVEKVKSGEVTYFAQRSNTM